MARIEGGETRISAIKIENKAKVNSENKPSALSNVNDFAGRNSKLGELSNRESQLKSRINGAANEVPKPPDIATQATVSNVGGEVIIDTGAGDNTVGVRQDAKTGDVIVSVNGAERTFSGADRNNLVIRAGSGDDSITVSRGVTVRLRLEGGDGDDNINVSNSVTSRQTIEGGAGNDVIYGGGGRDYINGSTGEDRIYGRGGSDVIYGGDADDFISGGSGDDYIDGGKGNDRLYGFSGADILSGGIGDDTINGGTGDDVLYAGQGTDNLIGSNGRNLIYAQTADDTIQATETDKNVNNVVINVELTGNPGNTSVSIVGSSEFVERVEADLETLRSSPIGREMLESFDASTHSVTIKEQTIGGGNSASTSGTGDVWYDEAKGKNGSGKNGIVNYEAASVMRGSAERPPLVGLFHEMAHAYDYTHGTLRPGVYNGTDLHDKQDTSTTNPKPDVNVRERVGTGLTIDHDNDPTTPEILDPVHPENLTENGLRDEMNLPKRDHYRN